MGTGIFNLVVGLVFVVGGAMGEITLLGTNSSAALAVLGAVIASLGVYQIVRARRGG